MSWKLIVVTSLIYTWVAIEQYMKGNIGFSMMYFGYVIANLGTILALR